MSLSLALNLEPGCLGIMLGLWIHQICGRLGLSLRSFMSSYKNPTWQSTLSPFYRGKRREPDESNLEHTVLVRGYAGPALSLSYTDDDSPPSHSPGCSRGRLPTVHSIMRGLLPEQHSALSGMASVSGWIGAPRLLPHW